MPPDGEQLTLEQWAEMFEGTDRHVARDELTLPSGEHVLVSTVWLGIEHGMHGDLPLIFETMVFGVDEVDQTCIRTSTRDEARAAHEQAVDYARRIAVVVSEVEQ